MESMQAAPEYLTQDQLRKVLGHCGVRERAMFTLAYGHALRSSEIADLTLDSVKNGKIHCVRGKKSCTTTEDLRPAEIEALNAWLTVRDEDAGAFLFNSRQGSRMTRQQVYNLFRKVAELAGVTCKHKGSHLLKHSYASHLIRAGVDLAYVQVACGHKHISSTTRYTHVSVSEAQAKSNAVVSSIYV